MREDCAIETWPRGFPCIAGVWRMMYAFGFWHSEGGVDRATAIRITAARKRHDNTNIFAKSQKSSDV